MCVGQSGVRSARWSPREDSNLRFRVRSPAVSCISLRGDGPHGPSRTAILSFGRSCAFLCTTRGWGRQPDSNRRRQLEGLPGSPLPHAAVWSPNTGSNRALPDTGRLPRHCGWGMVPTLGVEPSPPGLQPGASTGLAWSALWSCCSESNRDLLVTGQARLL